MHLQVSSLLLLSLLAQTPTSSGVYTMVFTAPGLEPVRYALSLPRGYNPREPRPLVLALHPGGPRVPGYGASFAQQVVAPGLSPLSPIIVAPDCPSQSWTDPATDRAVTALLQNVMKDYPVDAARVLVVGFSMGGRGAWSMSAQHPDLFTGAIVMAGSAGDLPVDQLGRMPTYVIHSRDDEVAPFAPAERLTASLRRLKRPIESAWLDGVPHFEMGRYVDALREAGRWMMRRWR